jgi:hypothetical protein
LRRYQEPQPFITQSSKLLQKQSAHFWLEIYKQLGGQGSQEEFNQAEVLCNSFIRSQQGFVRQTDDENPFSFQTRCNPNSLIACVWVARWVGRARRDIRLNSRSSPFAARSKCIGLQGG